MCNDCVKHWQPPEIVAEPFVNQYDDPPRLEDPDNEGRDIRPIQSPRE